MANEELRAGALNVITTVKYDIDLINAINRMTFLFDPNWQGIGNSLPISFFFVKSFKEVMETEVSKKSVLFYNSQANNNPDAVAGGLLGVISDNIINKPKKYQMEIIVPRSLDVYLRQAIFNKRVTFGDLFHNEFLAVTDSLYAMYSEVLFTLIKILNSQPLSTLAELGLKDFISESIAGVTDDTNKASLDAMWENRTILKMKYWNGWQFRYVAVENYIPSKIGEEDNVYTATLNLTEIPIMTIRNSTANPLVQPRETGMSKMIKAERLKKLQKALDSAIKEGL